jgi:hypothetical protein
MTLAIQLTSIIVSILALITAIASLAMVIGMKLSTHKIEWKPLDISGDVKPTEEEIDQTEDEELLNKALSLQKKKKRQEDPLDVIAETSNF